MRFETPDVQFELREIVHRGEGGQGYKICRCKATRKGKRFIREAIKGLKEGEPISFKDIPLLFGEEFIEMVSAAFDSFEEVLAAKGEDGLRSHLKTVPRSLLKTMMFTLDPVSVMEGGARSPVNELAEAVKAMAQHRRRRARR